MLPAPGQKNTIYNSMPRRWYPIRKDVNNVYLDKITKTEIDIINKVCFESIDKFNYNYE